MNDFLLLRFVLDGWVDSLIYWYSSLVDMIHFYLCIGICDEKSALLCPLVLQSRHNAQYPPSPPPFLPFALFSPGSAMPLSVRDL